MYTFRDLPSFALAEFSESCVIFWPKLPYINPPPPPLLPFFFLLFFILQHSSTATPRRIARTPTTTPRTPRTLRALRIHTTTRSINSCKSSPLFYRWADGQIGPHLPIGILTNKTRPADVQHGV